MIVRIVGDAHYEVPEDHAVRVRDLHASGKADPIQLADQVRRHGTRVSSDRPAELVIDDAVAGDASDRQWVGPTTDWSAPTDSPNRPGIRPGAGTGHKALDDVEPVDDIWS